jgi:hypothetical protein
MCYMLLLFAANTDNTAGVMRGLRDANINQLEINNGR